jgi:hypothetical protein
MALQKTTRFLLLIAFIVSFSSFPKAFQKTAPKDGGAKKTTTEEVTKEEITQLSVKVTRGDNAIPDLTVIVSWDEDDSTVQKSKKTNKKGICSFKNLPKTNLTLRVIENGQEISKQEIDPESTNSFLFLVLPENEKKSDEKKGPAGIKPEATGENSSAKLIVLRPDGKQVGEDGPMLLLVNKILPGIAWVIRPHLPGIQLNEAAEYDLRGIKPGEYTVSARAAEYSETPMDLTIPVSGTVYFRLTERDVTPRPAGINLIRKGQYRIGEPEQPLQFYRAIIGFEQTGASSTPSSTNFFLNLYGVRPLVRNNLLLWGDLRLTSIPAQKRTGIISDSVSTLTDSLSSLPISQSVNSIAFQIGAQYRFPKQIRIGDTHFFTSLYAGFGGITPIDPPNQVFEPFSIDSPQLRSRLFNFVSRNRSLVLPPNALSADGSTINSEFDKVVFVGQERSRFNRQYFAGFRFETFYLKNKSHPGIIDIGFGQNEAVTGGRLKGGVARFDAFLPLPIPIKLGTTDLSGVVYIYGSALMRTTRRVGIQDALILPRFDGSLGFNDTKLLIISSPQADRDFYRIGAGIDLLQLFRNFKRQNVPPATQSGSVASTPNPGVLNTGPQPGAKQP